MIEQITFVLRYVHKEEDVYMVKENFGGFKEQHREMTGDAVASTILVKMQQLITYVVKDMMEVAQWLV